MELENPQQKKTVSLQVTQKDIVNLRACLAYRIHVLNGAMMSVTRGTGEYFCLKNEIEDLEQLDTIVGLKVGAIK